MRGEALRLTPAPAAHPRLSRCSGAAIHQFGCFPRRTKAEHRQPDLGIRRGFSLVELLVCIAVVTLLIGLLLPGLSAIRRTARMTACLSNVRQLGMSWQMYASDYADRAMPLAGWRVAQASQIYWWGSHGTDTTPPDFAAGFLAPYIDSGLSLKSVFDCPAQPWGTYRPQGPSKAPTSTYGYNGYYLSPSQTPGWGNQIAYRPWRRIYEVPQPTKLLVFADTMVPPAIATGTPMNCALLDPPKLFSGPGQEDPWIINDYPTTSFRHMKTRNSPSSGLTVGVHADGSASTHAPDPAALVNTPLGIGSISVDNDPWYVPDWREWR
jgi:prepilin-type N-terminal cleavage/methylation domain-containing protein